MTKAFAEADRVFENEFRTQAMMHVPLEPMVLLAVPEDSDRIALLGPSPSSPDEQDIPALVEKTRDLAALLREGRGGQVQTLVGDILDRIDITLSEVQIALGPAGLGRHLGMTIDAESPALLITSPATLKRSALAMRMVLETGEAATSREPGARIIGAIARAHRWWGRLLEKSDLTITDLAQSEGVTSSYMTRVIRLAFLDPAIVTRIVEGKAPAGIDTKRLIQTDAISLSWNEQRQRFGFPAHR